MRLEKAEVEQIARLAGLNLTPEETQRISGQLSLIVDFFDQLGMVDTSAISSEKQSSRSANVFRQDSVRPSLPREKVLSLADECDGDCFLVPKVLG